MISPIRTDPSGGGALPAESSQSSAASASGTAPSAGGDASALTSDFETFLRMLTVQMQNQDPLNPIESSDFAVQLATFSGVEQQVLTNDLLGGLSQGIATPKGLSDYAGWIGREAETTAPVAFTGQAIDLALPKAPAGADRGTLIVRDTAGEVVQDMPVAPGRDRLAWDGTASRGERLAQGTYSFEMRWSAGPEELGADPVGSFSPVAEVRLSRDGDVEVVLADGGVVPAEDVTAVRAA